MNPTIHVELPCSCDADDLVEFLAPRGLTGSITRANDHCEIDVRYAVDPDARLCREFEAAIGSWLAGHDRPLIPMRSGSHGYVLRPPGD